MLANALLKQCKVIMKGNLCRHLMNGNTDLFCDYLNGYRHLLQGFGDKEFNKDIIMDDNGCTLLHVAAFLGKENEVVQLLRCGAEVNAADVNFNTAAHFAVYGGHLKLAERFLDVEDPDDTGGHSGFLDMPNDDNYSVADLLDAIRLRDENFLQYLNNQHGKIYDKITAFFAPNTTSNQDFQSVSSASSNSNKNMIPDENAVSTIMINKKLSNGKKNKKRASSQNTKKFGDSSTSSDRLSDLHCMKQELRSGF